MAEPRKRWLYNVPFDISAAALSEDGTTLVMARKEGSSDERKKATVWSLPTLAQREARGSAAQALNLGQLVGHTSVVQDVAVSASGSVVATAAPFGDYAQTLKIWMRAAAGAAAGAGAARPSLTNLHALRFTVKAPGKRESYVNVALSRDGRHLAAVGNESRYYKHIHVYAVPSVERAAASGGVLGAVLGPSPKLVKEVKSDFEHIAAMKFSANASLLLAAGQGHVKIWAIGGRAEARQVVHYDNQLHGGTPHSVACSERLGVIAVPTTDGVRMLEAPVHLSAGGPAKEVHTNMGLPTDMVRMDQCCATAMDSKFRFVASEQHGQVRVHVVPSSVGGEGDCGNATLRFTSHGGDTRAPSVLAMSFTEDDKTLIAVPSKKGSCITAWSMEDTLRSYADQRKAEAATYPRVRSVDAWLQATVGVNDSSKRAKVRQLLSVTFAVSRVSHFATALAAAVRKRDRSAPALAGAGAPAAATGTPAMYAAAGAGAAAASPRPPPPSADAIASDEAAKLARRVSKAADEAAGLGPTVTKALRKQVHREALAPGLRFADVATLYEWPPALADRKLALKGVAAWIEASVCVESTYAVPSTKISEAAGGIVPSNGSANAASTVHEHGIYSLPRLAAAVMASPSNADLLGDAVAARFVPQPGERRDTYTEMLSAAFAAAAKEPVALGPADKFNRSLKGVDMDSWLTDTVGVPAYRRDKVKHVLSDIGGASAPNFFRKRSGDVTTIVMAADRAANLGPVLAGILARAIRGAAQVREPAVPGEVVAAAGAIADDIGQVYARSQVAPAATIAKLQRAWPRLDSTAADAADNARTASASAVEAARSRASELRRNATTARTAAHAVNLHRALGAAGRSLAAARASVHEAEAAAVGVAKSVAWAASAALAEAQTRAGTGGIATHSAVARDLTAAEERLARIAGSAGVFNFAARPDATLESITELWSHVSDVAEAALAVCAAEEAVGARLTSAMDEAHAAAAAALAAADSIGERCEAASRATCASSAVTAAVQVAQSGADELRVALNGDDTSSAALQPVLQPLARLLSAAEDAVNHSESDALESGRKRLAEARKVGPAKAEAAEVSRFDDVAAALAALDQAASAAEDADPGSRTKTGRSSRSGASEPASAAGAPAPDYRAALTFTNAVWRFTKLVSVAEQKAQDAADAVSARLTRLLEPLCAQLDVTSAVLLTTTTRSQAALGTETPTVMAAVQRATKSRVALNKALATCVSASQADEASRMATAFQKRAQMALDAVVAREGVACVDAASALTATASTVSLVMKHASEANVARDGAFVKALRGAEAKLEEAVAALVAAGGRMDTKTSAFVPPMTEHGDASAAAKRVWAFVACAEPARDAALEAAVRGVEAALRSVLSRDEAYREYVDAAAALGSSGTHATAAPAEPSWAEKAALQSAGSAVHTLRADVKKAQSDPADILERAREAVREGVTLMLAREGHACEAAAAKLTQAATQLKDAHRRATEATVAAHDQFVTACAAADTAMTSAVSALSACGGRPSFGSSFTAPVPPEGLLGSAAPALWSFIGAATRASTAVTEAVAMGGAAERELDTWLRESVGLHDGEQRGLAWAAMHTQGGVFVLSQLTQMRPATIDKLHAAVVAAASLSAVHSDRLLDEMKRVVKSSGSGYGSGTSGAERYILDTRATMSSESMHCVYKATDNVTTGKPSVIVKMFSLTDDDFDTELDAYARLDKYGGPGYEGGSLIVRKVDVITGYAPTPRDDADKLGGDSCNALVFEGGMNDVTLNIADGGAVGSRARASYNPKGWLKNVALALRTVHMAGLVHGDVKAENVIGFLMKRSGTVEYRLGDFDCAVRKGSNVRPGYTAAYAPPERLRAQHRAPRDASGVPTPTLVAHPGQDVWAFGILVYYALTGEIPFASEDDAMRKLGRDTATAQRTVADLLRSVDNKDVKRLLEETCLVVDPTKRGTMANVLQQQVFVDHLTVTSFGGKILGEMRVGFAGIHDHLDTSLTGLSRLIVSLNVGEHDCPRLVVLVPDAQDAETKKQGIFAKGITGAAGSIKVKLGLLQHWRLDMCCEAGTHPALANVEGRKCAQGPFGHFSINLAGDNAQRVRDRLKKAGPALKAAGTVLSAAARAGKLLGVPLPDIVPDMGFLSDVNSFFGDYSSLIDKMGKTAKVATSAAKSSAAIVANPLMTAANVASAFDGEREAKADADTGGDSDGGVGGDGDDDGDWDADELKERMAAKIESELEQIQSEPSAAQGRSYEALKVLLNTCKPAFASGVAAPKIRRADGREPLVPQPLYRVTDLAPSDGAPTVVWVCESCCRLAQVLGKGKRFAVERDDAPAPNARADAAARKLARSAAASAPVEPWRKAPTGGTRAAASGAGALGPSSPAATGATVDANVRAFLRTRLDVDADEAEDMYVPVLAENHVRSLRALYGIAAEPDSLDDVQRALSEGGLAPVAVRAFVKQVKALTTLGDDVSALAQYLAAHTSIVEARTQVVADGSTKGLYDCRVDLSNGRGVGGADGSGGASSVGRRGRGGTGTSANSAGGGAPSRSSGAVVSTSHRFSDFYKLHGAVKQAVARSGSGVSMPPRPSKAITTPNATQLKQPFLNKRRVALQSLLVQLAGSVVGGGSGGRPGGGCAAAFPIVLDFLSVDKARLRMAYLTSVVNGGC